MSFTNILAVTIALSGIPALGPIANAQASVETSKDDLRIADIREALLRLPYYGVFDFLTFTYEKGTVVLGGYAYLPSLVPDAERTVKRVAGVDKVILNVKELPASINDDDIRWRTFYAIYTNDFLSKYAPGGGVLWGHRHPFRRGLLEPWGAFPGMQPVGNYPIHIVVERGRVRLLGMVDTEADKTAAGFAARGVSGSFGVDNELIVDSDRPQTL